jgi:transcriptional regulator with XRE-family HTH domain
MHPTFNEIDQQRRAAGLSMEVFCRNAHVSLLTYKRWKTGKTAKPKLRTLARFKAALAGRGVGARAANPPSSDLVLQHFNAVLAICSHAAGLPMIDAIRIDTKANRPRNVDWLALMRIRQVAMYIVSTEGNVRGADLARALKISKQAVSKACRSIEDRRDEPAFDALLTRIAELMEGAAA